MKDDLIKRSDAIGACAYETIECYEARKTIRNLPSADRPRGEWIYQDDDVFAGKYYCDNCDSQAEVNLYGEWILSNYCPNCGARMKGADDE